MAKDKNRESEPLYIFIYYILNNLPELFLFYSFYSIINYIPVYIMNHNLNRHNSINSKLSNYYFQLPFMVMASLKIPLNMLWRSILHLSPVTISWANINSILKISSITILFIAIVMYMSIAFILLLPHLLELNSQFVSSKR